MRRATYVLTLTPHQRSALLSVLGDYIGRPDAIEVSVDAATGGEIPIGDLLALLLNLEPTIEEDDQNATAEHVFDAPSRELLISLGTVVTALVNWARERQPGYPFDHNGECLFCDEMGAHAAECPWPVVERSVFGEGGG